MITPAMINNPDQEPHAYQLMGSGNGPRNPYQFGGDHNDQEQCQDKYYGGSSNSSSNGLLHDYPSSHHNVVHHHHHHGGHVPITSYNINGGGGGGVPFKSSSNDDQFVSNGDSRDQLLQLLRKEEVEGPLQLTLTISEALIRHIESTLTQEKQQQRLNNNNNNNQQQVVMSSQPPQPQVKLKASNLPALFLRVGSWKWESKNPGDLVAKFYYGKKKMVWEILSGPMKKKIEIRWTQVSAINGYVDEEKNGRLEIELGDPPEYYQECKFQPLKHTQWERTKDFTQGQAPICRRHTILFSPGVLEEPLQKLLQYDNHLYNLNQQPFPIHNSHFFDPRFGNSYNNIICSSVNGCSQVPHSNNLQNFHHQQTNSFVQHSGSNVPMPGIQMFPEVAMEISHVNEITNGVLEQNGNNQTDQYNIPLPPIREQNPYEGLEPIISNEQMEIHHVDNLPNLTEVTADENPFKVVESSFKQNHENDIFNHLVGTTDYSCSNGGEMINHHMPFADEDDVSHFADIQFNGEFGIPERMFWSASQSRNGGNGGGSST